MCRFLNIQLTLHSSWSQQGRCCLRFSSRGRPVSVYAVTHDVDTKTFEAESQQVWAEQVRWASIFWASHFFMIEDLQELMSCLFLQQHWHRHPTTGLQKQHRQTLVNHPRVSVVFTSPKRLQWCLLLNLLLEFWDCSHVISPKGSLILNTLF